MNRCLQDKNGLPSVAGLIALRGVIKDIEATATKLMGNVAWMSFYEPGDRGMGPIYNTLWDQAGQLRAYADRFKIVDVPVEPVITEQKVVRA